MKRIKQVVFGNVEKGREEAKTLLMRAQKRC